jgi:hypothetical protein
MAEIFYLDPTNIGYEDEYCGEDTNEVVLEKINVYMRENPDDFYGIKRGDLVSLVEENARYRNNGIYIYDGVNTILLEREIDDYGHVPKEFIVSDDGVFSPEHWLYAIQHNTTFFVSKEILERLEFHQTYNQYGSSILSSDVNICGKIYNAWFEWPHGGSEETQEMFNSRVKAVKQKLIMNHNKIYCNLFGENSFKIYKDHL